MRSFFARALQTIGLAAALTLGAAAPAAAQNTCPAANPYDSVADDVPLQACLDGGGTIALTPNASPGYILRWGLRIRVAGTILTTTTQQPQNYARLVADPALGSDGDGRLILTQDFVDSWQISYIWLDGNKSNRIAQSSGCSTDYRPAGINATLKGSGFVVKFSRFTNAMCGSGLEVSGNNYEVYQNYFGDNGRESGASHPWADGVTLLSCNGGYVHHNEFVNNTDVDIVLFASNGGCQVRWNSITHNSTFGFAGLALGDTGTNNVNGLISDNTISASYNKLLFGINVGGQFWRSSLGMVPNIGRVEANQVTGAFANLVVDGVSNGVFTGNISQSPQGTSGHCSSPQSYTAAHIGGGMSVQSGSVPLSWVGAFCNPAPGPPAGTPVVSIASGGYLLPNQCVDSPNSTHKLCFQGDANLVLYQMPSWVAVWHTHTYGNSPGAAIMQTHGNLVVYNSNWQPLWSTPTAGNYGAFLSLDASGGLRLYSTSNQMIWSR